MNRNEIARELVVVAKELLSVHRFRPRSPFSRQEMRELVRTNRAAIISSEWSLLENAEEFQRMSEYDEEGERSGPLYQSFDMYSGGSFHEYWEYLVPRKDRSGEYLFSEAKKAEKEFTSNAVRAWELVRGENRTGANRLVGGTMSAPPAMVAEISAWATENVAAKRLATELGYLKWLSSQESPDDDLLRKSREKVEALRKEARGGKPDWSSMKRQFRVDLSGWKYAKLAGDVPDRLTVFLRDSVGPSTWDPSKKVVTIRSGLAGYGTLWKLGHSVEHELLHWAQDVVGGDFGRPPKRLRDRVDQNAPARGLKKEERHSLDDAEFYPMLLTSLSRFRNQSDGDVRRFLKEDEFFRNLKRRNPEKWTKAVKEFVKMIDKEG